MPFPVAAIGAIASLLGAAASAYSASKPTPGPMGGGGGGSAFTPTMADKVGTGAGAAVSLADAVNKWNNRGQQPTQPQQPGAGTAAATQPTTPAPNQQQAPVQPGAPPMQSQVGSFLANYFNPQPPQRPYQGPMANAPAYMQNRW